MDLDQLALMFDEKEADEIVLVEIHILKKDSQGRVHRKTVVIDYDDENDYQWSTTSRMIG